MRHDETGAEQQDDDERELREDDVLLTKDEACAFIGGPAKPIDPSNLYRGIQAGIYHPPIHPTPGTSRWVQRWLASDRARQVKGGR